MSLLTLLGLFRHDIRSLLPGNVSTGAQSAVPQSQQARGTQALHRQMHIYCEAEKSSQGLPWRSMVITDGSNAPGLPPISNLVDGCLFPIPILPLT